MGTFLALLLFVVSGIFVVYVGLHFRWLRSCRAGAKKIHGELTRVFGGEHEFRIVNPSQFPAVDRAGYEAVRTELVREGFRGIGTFEDVTISQVYPFNRTYIEAFLSGDGTVGVGTYRFADRQIVDLSSELEDGRLVVTSNAQTDSLSHPAEILRELLPPESSVKDLVAAHLARQAEIRSRNLSARFVVHRGLDDAIGFAKKHSRLSSEHRRSLGFLTKEELAGFATQSYERATIRQVWKEFVRLQQTA